MHKQIRLPSMSLLIQNDRGANRRGPLGNKREKKSNGLKQAIKTKAQGNCHSSGPKE